MKNLKCSLLLLFLSTLIACSETKSNNKNSNSEEKEEILEEVKEKSVKDMSYVETSQALLNAIKNKKDTKEYTDKLAVATREALDKELDTKEEKFAFWVNVYNAQIQLILSENPDLYKDRKMFFGEERFTIAGKALSFDLTEHGILRSSTMKISMGYVGKLFTSDFEERFRTEEVDPRLHFVLNCGAKDCPPVYVFQAETLNEDFDRIAKAYLEKHTEYMPNEGKNGLVKTTPLASWFRGDFGEKDGVLKMLKQYDIIPDNVEPELEFGDYDWTLDLDNFG